MMVGGLARVGQGDGAARKGGEGFTLVEVLIALFVMSIIVTILYGAYSGAMTSIRQTSEQMAVYRMAAIASQRLLEDLESAAPVPAIGTAGALAGGQLFQGAREKERWQEEKAVWMEWTSWAGLGFRDEAPRLPLRLRYSIRKMAGQKSFSLLRSAMTGASDDQDMVVATGLQDVQFLFFDKNGVAHEKWPPEGKEELRLDPSWVAFELSFENDLDAANPVRFAAKAMLPSPEPEP